MSGVTSAIFGSGDDGGIEARLAAQERAQRESLSAATKNEASVDQSLATPRRAGRGRSLLEFLGNNAQLGG